MTPMEQRQRWADEVCAALEKREADALYAGIDLDDNPTPVNLPVRVRPIMPVPRESFNVTVVQLVEGRPHRHTLSVLACDRDEAEWMALAYFRGPHPAHIQSLNGAYQPSSYATADISGMAPHKTRKSAWHYEGDFKRWVAKSPLHSLQNVAGEP